MGAIPIGAWSEAVAVLGRTGSGKTFAAKGAIEGFVAAGERVVVLDPTGVWWGMRSSADGKHAGLAVAVFGGLHGDVAINEAAGAPLAKLIAERNLPAIVDVSELTMGGRVRFATAFLEALYTSNRRPLTIVFDEADLFAPQRPMPDQTVLLNRMEQIVRRGRVRGFKPWLITQRPAELHKSVLSQAGTLIAMRLTAPQDRDAIGAWIDGQADRAEGKKVLDALPKLARGQGFLWCPAVDFLEKITFPPITTFDSGRTPEHGESIEPPTRLADVDLSGVLEALKSVKLEPKVREPRASTIDQPSLVDAEKRGYQRGYAEGQLVMLMRFRSSLDAMRDAVQLEVNGPDLPDRAAPPSTPPVARQRKAAPALPGAVLPKAERLILSAIAQYSDGRSKTQVAILTGYSARGGGFSNSISALRTKGYLVGGPERLVATAAGLEALGDFDVLPSGAALREYWYRRLARAERESLRALCDAHPRALTKQQVANAAGYEASGGGFNNALSKLRTLDLIKGSRELRANPALF